MAKTNTTRARRAATRKPRTRTLYKKKLVQVQPKKVIQGSSSIEDTTSTSGDNFSKIDNNNNNNNGEIIDFDEAVVGDHHHGCSTPKAQRFRIPEIVTCPPAPKKQRVVSNCSLQRTPIAFYAPPDIELFFFFALRDISV